VIILPVIFDILLHGVPACYKYARADLQTIALQAVFYQRNVLSIYSSSDGVQYLA
jgi:hypothetical protein